uniref:Uncharacterized protein n=1 Tax=viral metagenome TaxID=1070528 RepID=A0A6C0I0V3_9ZZZZ
MTIYKKSKSIFFDIFSDCDFYLFRKKVKNIIIFYVDEYF